MLASAPQEGGYRALRRQRGGPLISGPIGWTHSYLITEDAKARKSVQALVVEQATDDLIRRLLRCKITRVLSLGRNGGA
jgi:hypothetical protein